MSAIQSKKIFISPVHDSEDEILHSYEEFDSKGNQLLSITYDANGDMDEKVIQKYNEAGMLVEQSIYDFSNEPVEKHSFAYSGNIMLTEEIYYADGSVSVRHFNRQTPGLLLEQMIAEDGVHEEKVERYWNESGQVIKQLFYDEDQKLTRTEEFEYAGKLRSKLKETDHTEKMVVIHEFTYSPANLLLSQVSKNEAGKVLSYIQFEYDEKARVLKQKGSSSRSSIVYEYDDENNTITELHFSPMGTIDHRLVTHMDENGNISLQTTLLNQRRFEYTYFES